MKTHYSPLFSWLLIWIGLAFFEHGCTSRDVPPSPLNEEHFVPLYCSLLRNAQHMKNWGQDPRSSKQYADSVLARAGITKDQFDETVRWYNADVHRWKTFAESVILELERPDSATLPHPSL